MARRETIRLRIYLAVFGVFLCGGVAGFVLIEGFSVTDAVYFSIVTMATVGYGDLHPQTGLGKLLALVMIVGGVGTFLGVIASITDVLVNRREEELRDQKLNMVTGLFFSEMGSELLKRFARLDPGADTLYRVLDISKEWGLQEFRGARKALEHHPIAVDSSRGDVGELRDYLQEKAGLLLRLLENPAIQEHEAFTDLLHAVFHLRDELLHREGLTSLPDSDRHHLEGDITRIYRLLIFEWLRYMQHLQASYTYLFSLAMRTNPFDPDANAVVREG